MTAPPNGWRRFPQGNNRNVRRYRVKGLKKNRFSRFVGLADRRSICLDAGLNPTFVDRHDKFARRKNRRRQLGEQFGQVDFMLAHMHSGTSTAD